ncbi:hypothetical protein [Streptomyces sp. NBC_01187]|uniref:hypothetical protein n=1 Tax=Streptomyces sp. NBC_01187 TaxID=2903766 RepID=UPI002F90AAF5|nr:hypothetical protein OG220_42235 [Streptomyces sp. NBC_01187]
MTDIPRPESPVGDALFALTPAVVPIDGADAELVFIGERYWSLAGFREGYPVWSEKVKDIDSAGWGQQKHAVAAAGVRAVIPGRQCAQCDGPLSLTSRTALQQVLDGQTPPCVECTESLLEAVRLVLDPARKAKRDAAQAKSQAEQAAHDAREQWQQHQKKAIAHTYVAVFPKTGDALPSASVRQMLGALALLRYAPTTAPLPGRGSWPDLWHPNPDKDAALLGELVRAELIKIHASSPVDAFVWEPESFEEGVREAGGDLDSVAQPKLTGSFYPTRACYFVPYGTSAGKAVEALDARLADALAPAGMTAASQDDLLVVARELLAEETLRYFTARLNDLFLPAVPDNHTARLEEAAYKVAARRNLGEMYNLAWRSTRAAAEAAQKNPRAPRAHMTTHAVNQFESHAQRAAADPEWELKAFSEIPGHGPAAMTRTLFYAVLDSHPTETSLPQVRAALPSPVSETVPDQFRLEDGDELEIMIDWLKASPGVWNPAEALAALVGLKEAQKHDDGVVQFEQRLVARGAAQLHRLYERLAPAIGDQDAILAVVASTALLVHPLSPGESTTGDWIRHHLGCVLLGIPDERTGESDEANGPDQDR